LRSIESWAVRRILLFGVAITIQIIFPGLGKEVKGEVSRCDSPHLRLEPNA
jgi:hypothetical protein